jgi:hypothetical protein
VIRLGKIALRQRSILRNRERCRQSRCCHARSL